MKTILTIAFTLAIFTNMNAQTTSNYFRTARIVVDSSRLEEYKAALAEHAKAAVKLEPGVIMLYAVYEKNNPTHVDVFEVYKDLKAYQSHIKAPHFLKYKETVKDMVKSLEVTDAVPIALERK